MEAHRSSEEAPDFKWEILEAYPDALRRQLAEGLHILEAGGLNKHMEFNSKILCRLGPVSQRELTEKELKKELEQKREEKVKLQNFIAELVEKDNNVIDLFGGKPNKKKKTQVAKQKVINLLCCRSNTPSSAREGGLTDRKRKRETMETSFPITERRENNLIELEEDSPIGRSFDAQLNGSIVSDESGDVIPSSKKKAGISDDIDIMAVTPPQEVSPDTMDRRLPLHCVYIVRSSKNNNMLQELQEPEDHDHDILTNSFAKRSDGQFMVRPGAKNESNTEPVAGLDLQKKPSG